MKQNIKKQLENIVVKAIERYFQESGINQILLSLYKSSISQGQSLKFTKNQSVPKIKNIIEKNSKSMSKIQQLKQQNSQDGFIFDTDEKVNIPQMGIQQSVTPSLRFAANENIDPLQTGKSILDNGDLPSFLKRSLGKIQRNAKS